jgi:hypothetical protein
MTQIAAVLTGDLIASTQAGLEAVDGAMAAIHSVAKHEAEISGLDVRFARFRGDGWQIYCPDAARVFRLTVLVLANLRSRPALAQTRLSVATGTVSALPETGLASASGEVFSTSGHGLDGMTTQRLHFQSRTDGWIWQIALFSYLDWQSSRWSPEQAEAVALAFRHNPPRPRSVAGDLGISRQAAQARLSGAGYEPLLEASIAFDSILLPPLTPEGSP